MRAENNKSELLKELQLLITKSDWVEKFVRIVQKYFYPAARGDQKMSSCPTLLTLTPFKYIAGKESVRKFRHIFRGNTDLNGVEMQQKEKSLKRGGEDIKKLIAD